MNEQTALAWFESLERRFIETFDSKTEQYDVWSALYTEMRSALGTSFPPSHVVVRKWEDLVARGNKINVGDRGMPEGFVRGELIGVFRAATSLLKNGHFRSLADGIRAETIGQCLDQAEALSGSGYASAAMVLAGGALETHLLSLCTRFSLTWNGNGTIAKYKQALDQGRNNGAQSTVSSSDSSQIESWGKDRNDAAHSPATFIKSDQEVGHIIGGICQFLGRTQ